jgi:hypothetical protein
MVVLLISSFATGQTAQSTPVVNSAYWGTSNQGVPLRSGQVTKVSQNESVLTVYFAVAFSTKVSAISGSRLCVSPNSTSGVSTSYDTIPYVFDRSKGSGTVTLSPTGQQAGWVCTYTIKITDNLSQTATWLGSVELGQ